MRLNFAYLTTCCSLQDSSIPILAVSLPLDLTSTDGPLPTLPSLSLPLAYNTVYSPTQQESIDSLRRALQSGHVVDIAIDFAPDKQQWEFLEELIGKASENLENAKPIVICMPLYFSSSLLSSLP